MSIKNVRIGQIWVIKDDDDQSNWKRGNKAKTRPMLILNKFGHNIQCVPITSSDNAYKYDYAMKGKFGYYVLNQLKSKSDEEALYIKGNVPLGELTNVRKVIAEIIANPNYNYEHAATASERASYVTAKPLSNKNTDLGKSVCRAAKKLPNHVLHQLVSEYNQFPMKELVMRYRKYGIRKEDIYNIMYMNYAEA
jgi:hypothetical protein